MRLSSPHKKAQTAVEYMLLLGVVTAIALLGFKEFLPRVNRASEVYYNHAANAILGPPPLNGVEVFRANFP